ncbi:protein of unknown function [Bartonella clarridgeiae 73]|uniref:Uncharacterized protein n=1 Tax=Bartonella clarridgeiae (strain CCUG 45776 / CIP 104772 / 73) TaxID=696125 RepID=E6YGB5_BARC7|nr:hypothetical protein [Bartonella clarridgeiae]CBI75903.1 protein of unknown function [Bartonella clarridgeiae 73]
MKRNIVRLFRKPTEEVIATKSIKSIKSNSVQSREKIEGLLQSISGKPKILDNDLNMIYRSLALGERNEYDKRYMERIVQCLKVRLKEDYKLEDDSSLLKEIDNYVNAVRQEHSEQIATKSIKSIKSNSVQSREKIEGLLQSISGKPKILDNDLNMIYRSLALGERNEYDKRYMERIVQCLKVRLKEDYKLEDDSSLLKEIDNYVNAVRQEHSEQAVKIHSRAKQGISVSANREYRDNRVENGRCNMLKI